MSFAKRAKKHAKKGKIAPYMEAFIETHEKNEPDLVKKVRAAAAIREAELHVSAADESQPHPYDMEAPMDAASGTPAAVDMDFATQVDVLTSALGLARGTRLLGAGSIRALPKKRGPNHEAASTSRATAVSSDEVSALRELLAAKDATEWEMQAEMERMRRQAEEEKMNLQREMEEERMARQREK